MSLSFVRAVLQHDATASKTCFLQVGANDGPFYEQLYPLFIEPRTEGIAVEPLQHYADAARAHYAEHAQGSVQIVQAALDNRAGTRLFHHVSREAIEQKLVPDWCKGIGSFFTNRNALGGERTSRDDFQRIRPHICATTVQCMTIDSLLSNYAKDWQRIDLLSVDTQGAEWLILEHFDLLRWRPLIAIVQSECMTHTEREALLLKFRKAGYRMTFGDSKLTFIDETIVWQYWETVAGAVPRSPCLDLCERTVVRNALPHRVVRLDPSNIKEFLSESLPASILRLERPAQRSDYIRVAFVASFGGMWMDTDTIVTGPLSTVWDYILEHRPQLAAWTSTNRGDRSHVDNGLFAALSSSRLTKEIFDGLRERAQRLERQPNLCDNDWVFLGCRVFITIITENNLQSETLLLNCSGHALNRIEHRLDDFQNNRAIEQHMGERIERAIIVPLFHHQAPMRHMTEDSVRTHNSTLAHLLRKGLGLLHEF